MAIDSGRVGEFATRDENRRLRNVLMIVSQKQDPNVTPETDLEAFQNQGGYAPEEETRTPSSLTNRQKGKNVKKGDEAQRRAEESRGGEQQRPEDIWPNYPRMNIKPQDLLKILQLLPALTGGGLQMAGGPQLPNFKPMGRVIEGTRKGVLPMNETKIKQPLQIKQAMNYPPPSELDKWLQLYQRNGGSLRHLDPDMRRLILQRGAMKADAANNIRSLQSTGHQTVLDDNRPGHLKIIKQFKPPRA